MTSQQARTYGILKHALDNDHQVEDTGGNVIVFDHYSGEDYIILPTGRILADPHHAPFVEEVNGQADHIIAPRLELKDAANPEAGWRRG